MRSSLAQRTPSDAQQSRVDPVCLGGGPLSYYSSREGNRIHSSTSDLTGFDLVGDRAQREGTSEPRGLIAGVAVDKDPRELGDLSYPAAVVFLFNFDREVHVAWEYVTRWRGVAIDTPAWVRLGILMLGAPEVVVG